MTRLFRGRFKVELDLVKRITGPARNVLQVVARGSPLTAPASSARVALAFGGVERKIIYIRSAITPLDFVDVFVASQADDGFTAPRASVKWAWWAAIVEHLYAVEERQLLSVCIHVKHARG